MLRQIVQYVVFEYLTEGSAKCMNYKNRVEDITVDTRQCKMYVTVDTRYSERCMLVTVGNARLQVESKIC